MKIQSTIAKCTLLFLAMLPLSAFAQPTITSTNSASTLANALVGPGVTISNATITCPSGGSGTFSGASSPLNIGQGIILTSGNASSAAGSSCPQASTNKGGAGDAQLSALSGTTTNDACVLQFDFTAQGDEISFRYQFSSEEYPEYVCSQFNDVFGFFISGGTQYLTPKNIALVPGTTSTPVAINTVNSGTPGTFSTGACPATVYPAYFIDNFTPCGGNVVYDGFTTVLVAKAAVTPCATYHLKLGVADASDFILDSGVWLEESSLSVSPPTIVGCPGNMSKGTGTGATLCGTTVTWTEPSVTGNCPPVTVTKNHSPGDFFPVGTTTVTYVFTNAGGSSTCSFNVTVTDNTPPNAQCKNANPVLSGGTASITPADVNNGSTDNCGIASMSVTPNTFSCADAGMTIPVVLTVTDIYNNSSSCTAMVTVGGSQVTSCNIAVTPCGPAVCTGGVPTNIYFGYGPQCATMTATGTGGSGFTYSWSPGTNLSCTNCQSPVFTPTAVGSFTYTVTITNSNGCSRQCSVTFCVKDVRCGNNNNKVAVCHYTGSPSNPNNSLCISASAVPAHICGAHTGDRLGNCEEATCPGVSSGSKMVYTSNNNGSTMTVSAYPNPFNNMISVHIEGITNGHADVTVYDATGRKLEARPNQPAGMDIQVGQKLPPGVYTVEVRNGNESQRIRVTKY
jgi:hypothetical protein